MAIKQTIVNLPHRAIYSVIVVQKIRLGFQEHDVEIPHEIAHKKSVRLIKEYLSSRNVAKATLMSTSSSK